MCSPWRSCCHFKTGTAQCWYLVWKGKEGVEGVFVRVGELLARCSLRLCCRLHKPLAAAQRAVPGREAGSYVGRSRVGLQGASKHPPRWCCKALVSVSAALPGPARQARSTMAAPRRRAPARRRSWVGSRRASCRCWLLATRCAARAPGPALTPRPQGTTPVVSRRHCQQAPPSHKQDWLSG